MSAPDRDQMESCDVKGRHIIERVALAILIPLTDLGSPRDPKCPEIVDHIIDLAHRGGHFGGYIFRRALATKLANCSGVVIQANSFR